MSNYWDIHCIDCDEGAGLSINRGKEFLSTLLGSSEGLLHMYTIFDTLLGNSEFEIKIFHHSCQDSDLREFLKFYKKHRGHSMKPLDEYGRDTP